MYCINTSHPQYKALLNETGLHPDVLKAKISLWMTKNSKDVFPTTMELGLSAIKPSEKLEDPYQDFIDETEGVVEYVEPTLQNQSLIGNIFDTSVANWEHATDRDQKTVVDDMLLRALMAKKAMSIAPENKRKLDALSEVVGKKEAYRDYFEQNEVVRPGRLVLEKLEGRFSEEMAFENPLGVPEQEVSEDDVIKIIQDAVKSENSERAVNQMVKMSNQLGIPVEIISQADLESKFGISEATGQVKSFYKNGKVYLVDGVFTADIVFHEFAHPIIKALAKDNPQLFTKLYSDLMATEEGQAIFKTISGESSDYAPNSEEFMEEAIVRSLENKFAVPRTWVQNLLFAIKQFLRKALGKKINISNLNEKTTLVELFNMINEGGTFILDTEFLNANDVIMFAREYAAEVAEIEKMAAKETQNVINEFYDIAKKQLSNFTKENDIYRLLQEDLGNENFNGELQKLVKILDVLSTTSKKANLPLDIVEKKSVEEFKNRLDSFVNSIVQAGVVFDKFENKINDLVANKATTTEDLDALFAIDTYVNHWSDYIQSLQKKTYSTYSYNSPFAQRLNALQSKLNETAYKIENLKIESVIDVLYDHLNENESAVKEQYLDQLDALKKAGNMSEYNRIYEEFYGLSVAEQTELNSLNARTNLNVNTEKPRLEFLKLKTLRGKNISKEQLRSTMKNELGDSNWMNGMFESAMLNQDLVVRGFASYVNDALQEVNANVVAREGDFMAGLEPLLKKAGYDTKVFGEQGLGNAIQQVQKSFDFVDNEVVEHDEYAFISNFNGQDFQLGKLNFDIDSARRQYQATGTDSDLDALRQAEFALEDFLNDYMTRENIAEYYEHDKMFRTDIGIKTKELRDKLFEEMRLLRENINGDPSNYTLSDQMQKIWYDYQQMQNIYDKDGKLKTGDELAMANLLNDYAKLTKDFHTYDEIPGEFEKAQELYEDHLINNKNLVRNSPAFNQAVNDWIKHNTVVQLDEAYFDKRKTLLDERSKILENLDATNKSIADVSPLYEQIYAILKANKDTSGQYDGTMLSKNEQITITSLHEQIVEAQNKLFGLSGLTPEESSRLNDLTDYFAYYNAFRSKAEEDEYNDYMDRYKRKLLGWGITDSQIERVKQIDQELRSTTNTEATDVYQKTFMSLLEKEKDAFELLSKYLYDNFDGFDLDDGDIIDQTHLTKVLNDKDLVNDLASLNSDFADWFFNNHYEAKGIARDEKNAVIGEVDVYRKSAAWQHSKPADKKYYKKKPVYSKTTGALIGFLEVDGVPRVPNMSFMKRTVKPEYQTQIIERDFIDPNGKLVLANVDNRGRFLPKEDAKDSTYINGNYRLMFNKNRDLFNLMLYIKNQFLDNQQGLDNSQKRYLLYPSFRKGKLESVTSKGYGNRRLEAFKNIYTVRADDFESGIYSGPAETDIYNTLSRPIAGSYRLPINEVSTNIIKSMGMQLYGIEYYKALRKRNSFANMLQSSITDLTVSNTVLNLRGRFSTALRFTKKEDIDRSNRLKQVISIIDKQFKGKQVVPINSASYKTIDSVLKWASRTLSNAAFRLSPTSSMTNYFGGKIMLTLQATDKRLFTPVNMALTQPIASATAAKLVKDSFTNKEKDIQLQLLDLMDGVPDRLKKDIGDYGSKTIAQSVIEGEQWFVDRKIAQDSVAIHAFYTLLNNNSFMLNGKKTSLYEAVEVVNGRLHTKKGTPREFSISYDADGNAVLGTEIKKMMNKHQGVLLKIVGQADAFSEPEVYRYILGKYAFALMKFFTPMLQDRYSFSTRRKGGAKSLANAIRGKSDKRINAYTGVAETGKIVGAIEALNKIVTGKFSSLDRNAKIGLLHTLSGLAAKILIGLLVKGIMFNDDDNEEDDQFLTHYDPNDEHRFKKMSKTTGLPNLPYIHSRYTENSGRRYDSSDYWDLQMLRLALRVQREVETFEPTDAFKTVRNIATLKSPLGEGGITSAINLTTEIYNTLIGDPQTYTRAAGPYYGQQKNDNKYFNAILKFYGLTGKMVHPALAIERENSGRY